jgi:hypothetical protein
MADATDQTQTDRTDLPEGLHLREGTERALEIVDAGEVVWIDFGRMARVLDREDSVDWITAVVTCACAGLGVTEAFNAEGEELSVKALVEQVYAAEQALYGDEMD